MIMINVLLLKNLINYAADLAQANLASKNYIVTFARKDRF